MLKLRIPYIVALKLPLNINSTSTDDLTSNGEILWL